MLSFQEKQEPKEGNEMIILDVDGVLNSYSNFRFYKHFAMKSLKNLAKVHGRKKLLFELPKLRKFGGPNALFVFAKNYCGDERKFDQFCDNLINSLNFDLIAHDASMKEMIKRLGRLSNICIRSDGLGDIASAVWERVINNKKSSTIKLERLQKRNTTSLRKCQTDGQTILISSIEDNNFRLKTDNESWTAFADKYNIDLQKSVLLDDSRKNTKTAAHLGMLTVHISKLDSFLQKSKIGTVYKHSLSDILGKRLAKTLKKFKISYGRKVDPHLLFKTLLAKPSDSLDMAQKASSDHGKPDNKHHLNRKYSEYN